MKPIVLWLYTCAVMIFIMTVIGAITRLTESGLSMVEWRPLIGALPPLNEQEWQRVFDIYKDSPEFQKRTFWMGLEDFKAIFFWEWFHRLFGRMIGLIYALPLAFFWLKGMIPQGFKPKLLFVLLLGFAQGFMGWYMVKSGLVDIPAVSQFRLAAHLGLAILIAALCFWFALDLSCEQKAADKKAHSSQLAAHGWICLYAVIVTIIWGAFTAGLDAGLVYNTFPLMGERLVPPETGLMKPAWINFFHNPVAVQFLHRWLGILTGVIILSYWLHTMARGLAGKTELALSAMVLVQISLGIATLLSLVSVPLAALHQAGALVLMGVLLISIRKMTLGNGANAR